MKRAYSSTYNARNSRTIFCTILTCYFALSRIASVQPLSQNPYAKHLKVKIASSEAKCERRQNERSLVARELCSGCNRPPILCICESLPEQKISTSTHVLVLQHPNEFKRKSLSTVPLMPFVLENCKVSMGYSFEPDKLDLVQRFLQKGRKPLLLFPGPDALSLDENDDKSIGGTSLCTEPTNDNNLPLCDDNGQLLILVDGTWAEARRIIMKSPELVQQCTQVQFTADSESIYDVVRKEPEKHCVSTLEACAQALVLLEHGSEDAKRARDALETAMRHMVNVKRKIYAMRNPEPRFVRPGMRVQNKMKQMEEFEQQMFKNE
mmetsp:Transcript_19128/g.22113  ORF Transcript_19128/g.22113 Transcript_19128/m.22113 type:complete len:322 (+) Transcript_19128:78-1043(+)